MTFEEEFMDKFPSLKEFMYEDIKCKSIFNSAEMQEILVTYCLDKQRVKEVIEKLSYVTENGHKYIDSFELLEELDLKCLMKKF